MKQHDLKECSPDAEFTGELSRLIVRYLGSVPCSLMMCMSAQAVGRLSVMAIAMNEIAEDAVDQVVHNNKEFGRTDQIERIQRSKQPEWVQ